MKLGQLTKIWNNWTLFVWAVVVIHPLASCKKAVFSTDVLVRGQCALVVKTFFWGGWISGLHTAKVTNISQFQSTRRRPWWSSYHEMGWNVMSSGSASNAPSSGQEQGGMKIGGSETVFVVVTVTFHKKTCNGFWINYPYCKINFAHGFDIRPCAAAIKCLWVCDFDFSTASCSFELTSISWTISWLLYSSVSWCASQNFFSYHGVA